MLLETDIEHDGREDVEDAIVVEFDLDLKLGLVLAFEVTPKPKPLWRI